MHATTAAVRRRRARRRRLRAGTARRRTLARRARIAVTAAVAAALAAILLVFLPWAFGETRSSHCRDDPTAFPLVGVAGWQGEQLENAATIMRAGAALGLGQEAQVLGVMTAMGESSLRNLDYGDWETIGFTNPDGSRTTSLGLFQQQEWWGSVEQRMDPTSAATLFYVRLAALDGWQQMAPSRAIHSIQINTDPDYYARFHDDATTVVNALSGPCPA